MRRCTQANKAVMNSLICTMRKATPSLSAFHHRSPLSLMQIQTLALVVLTGNCLKVTPPPDQAATVGWWIVRQPRLSETQGWSCDSIPLKNMIVTQDSVHLSTVLCCLLLLTRSPRDLHTYRNKLHNLGGKLEQDAWLNYETLMMAPSSFPLSLDMSLQGKLGPPNTPDLAAQC